MTRKYSSSKEKSRNYSKIKNSNIITILILLFGVYFYSEKVNSNSLSYTSTTFHKEWLSKRKLEIPLTQTERKEQIIQHIGYTVSYNEDLLLPNWVAYELTRQKTQGNMKRYNQFIKDPSIKSTTATNADYAHSGYDKGHMAPAADMKWSDTAMIESFYFTNICPQHPELNRKNWKKLEEKIRDFAIRDSIIIIICGPIIEKQPKKIGKHQITVPHHFFKVILSLYGESPKAIGFLFNNERSINPLKAHTVTVDSVENITGMDFFASLPDELENNIESNIDISAWGL